MKVDEVLKEIEGGNSKLELSIDSQVLTDVVIFGAVTDIRRREFAFRDGDQKEFLNGLAKIINKKNNF